MTAESAMASEAIALAQQQDDLLEAAVREHSRLVYRIVYSVLRNPADAEDATQETFLRVLRHGKKLAQVQDQKAWLAQIAWRVAVERRRQTVRDLARSGGDCIGVGDQRSSRAVAGVPGTADSTREAVGDVRRGEMNMDSNGMNKEREAEQWLDDELHRYGNAEPRTGLEMRVLAGLRAEKDRVAARRRWWWAAGMIAATAVIVAGAWFGKADRGRKPAEPAVVMHRENTEAPPHAVIQPLAVKQAARGVPWRPARVGSECRTQQLRDSGASGRP